MMLQGCGGGEGTASPSPLGNSRHPTGATNATDTAAAPVAQQANDDDDGSGSPPDVDGRWSGTFTDAVAGTSRSIKATISQDGRAIVITTNLSGTGAMFTGTINSDGDMDLIDASDGEEWTTHSGPVSEHSVVIRDYVSGGLLNTIELTH